MPNTSSNTSSSTSSNTPNYHPLMRQLAASLRSRCGVGEGASIVVGCSGGADSVALLRALAILAPRRRWRLKLIVCHVQHHLREDAAENDAATVSKLASELGLAYQRCDIRPADLPGNVEANARKLRYRALTQVAVDRGAGFVATAHHADDQLETLLMRFLRGASLDGMRGIAWRRRLRTDDPDRRIYAIRPMLGASRRDAVNLLNLLDQPWREDATNADLSRTRARLRHQVVPLLKAIRADAADKAVSLTDQVEHLRELVQAQVEAASNARPEAVHHLDDMPREQARSLNPIVLTQMLRRDLIKAGASRDRLPGHALRPVVEAVRDSEGGVRTFTFSGGVTIEVGPKTLSVLQDFSG